VDLRKSLFHSIVPLMASLALAGIIFIMQGESAQFYAPIFGGLVGATATFYFLEAKETTKASRLENTVKKSIKSELEWYSQTLRYFLDNGKPTENHNLLSIQMNTPEYERFRRSFHNLPNIYRSIDFNTKLGTLEVATIITLNETFQQIDWKFNTCVYHRGNDPAIEVDKNNCAELQTILEEATRVL